MINHLSYSQINEYLTCQRSYRFKYVNEIPTESNEALQFGSAWHKMISQGLVGGGYYRAAWAEVAPNESLNLGAAMLMSDPVITTLQGLKPLHFTALNGMQYENKPFIDYYFVFTIPLVDVPIIGYIDMIASDGVPVDFKTAGRKWTQERADKDLQPTFYLAGLHAQGLLRANDFPAKFRYIIFLKKAPYEVQIIETTRTAEDVLSMFGLVGECYRAIQAGIFLPTGISSTWKCSQNYCDFYKRCLGGKIDNVG